MDESDSLYSDILEELECPICTDYMTPPIRLCETGHSICEPCMKKLARCPSCQKNFTNAKNITLQALAQKVRYPCPLGCNEKLKLDQRLNHEKNCTFRSYMCAMENCTWTGTLQEVEYHWKSKGNSLSYSNRRCQTLMTINSYFVNLVEAHNQLFWAKRKLETGRICWAVQLIGRPDYARNYFYEVDICESETSKCRIILKDYCKSIDIDNNDIFSTDICITAISTDCLGHFINKAQMLVYTIRINEVC